MFSARVSVSGKMLGMMTESAGGRSLALRGRRKQRTRRALADTAVRMFTEKGQTLAMAAAALDPGWDERFLATRRLVAAESALLAYLDHYRARSSSRWSTASLTSSAWT